MVTTLKVLLHHYTIVRSDGEEMTLEGMGTSFTDNSVAVAGNYNYTVIANNGVGTGLESVSNTVLFAPAGTLAFESFEVFPPEGWTTVGGNWKLGESDNAGGTAPEAQFNWNPAATGEQYLISKPLDTTGQSKVIMAFNHMVDYYGPGYFLKIVTSTDMATWETVHEFDNTQNIAAERITLEIENAHVGSSTFYVAFEFSGNSYQINDWFIDDVVVSLASDIEEDVMVKGFSLSQNYPNPFNPETNIRFNLASQSDVKLTVYNSNGELVNELINNSVNSGAHSNQLQWK